MKRKFENTPCLICGSSQRLPFLIVPNRFEPGEKFTLVQCRKCGFVYLNPRPDSQLIGKYYEDEQYQPHRLHEQSLLDRMYKFVRIWNNRYKRYLIEANIRKGVLLDFGCGGGEFAAQMSRAGWQVSGVEPAPGPRQHAVEQGLSVKANIDEVTQKFDVITLWHVLEHIHQARELIGKLQERLTDSGILLLALPNLKSSDARAYQSNWVAYDAPRHLYHFSPVDVKRLCAQYNFQIKEYYTLFLDTWYNILLSRQLETMQGGNFLTGAVKTKWTAWRATIKETIDCFDSSSIVYLLQPKS